MKLPIDAKSLLPQKEPFVMVDQLILSEQDRAITQFYIKEDNVLCENGFFSPSGMLENIAQTVAAGRGYEGAKSGETPKVGYIGSIKNLQIHFLPLQNTEIKTEITILNRVLNFTSVNGKIIVGTNVAAECELVVALAP